MASENVFTLFTTVSTIPLNTYAFMQNKAAVAAAFMQFNTLMCQTWHKPISY